MTTLGQVLATRSLIERRFTGESPVKRKLTKKEQKALDEGLKLAPLPNEEQLEQLALNRADTRAMLQHPANRAVRRQVYGRWQKPRPDTRTEEARSAALMAELEAIHRHRQSHRRKTAA